MVRMAWALICVLSQFSCVSYAGTARTADLGTIEQESGWLRVSGVAPVRQRHQSDCGPAALSAVLQFWGLPDSRRQVEAEVSGGQATPGATAGDLRDYARDRGLSAYVFEGSLEDIRHELRAGRPVIVGVHQQFTSERVLAHYVVVIGYHPRKQQVLVMDPAFGFRQDSVAGFLKEWRGSHELVLVVLPRTPSAPL